MTAEKKRPAGKPPRSGELQRASRERDIERLNRLYAALSELNRATVRAKSREELFQEVCRISTEKAGFKLGWVGRHEPETNAVVPVACAGHDHGYVAKIHVYADDRPEGHGATGTCIREGRVCIFNDFLRDPVGAPWHAAAAECGLRAVAGLPIFSQGKVWGALTIYDSEPNVFQDKEVALLEEATAAISFGMENLERETQRQQAEEATKASEERYRILVESMPLLAWRASHGGVDVDCNGRWYEYTGQTPAQARYHGWLAAVHPDDLARIIEQILHATNEGVPYELEYRLRRAADGSYRWHLSRAVPMRNKDGQITDWFGCAIDIEELKQAQQILKQAHDEQTERHRTELAHVARLSMMGEMAAGLAHELNQPLHAVTNYASGSLLRLRKTPQRDEQLVAALEEIRKEANRAATVARRVRRFAQKRESQFAEIAVNHLVKEVVLFSKAELEQHHARIALELAENLPPVIGDPVQIEQVIMNLVRNAWEAMKETPEEDRRLGITTVLHDEETIRLEVSDRGKGIGREDLERIFEPFFTTKPEGMGMGLAISRSIIQAHGGRLWVSANQDQGCTFSFLLPIEKRGQAMAGI